MDRRLPPARALGRLPGLGRVLVLGRGLGQEAARRSPDGRPDGGRAGDEASGSDAEPERAEPAAEPFGSYRADPALAAARDARRRGRRERPYRPFEALLLFRGADETLAELPRAATPQLKALVRAADPKLALHAVAQRAGLPLARVSRGAKARGSGLRVLGARRGTAGRSTASRGTS